MSAFVRRVWYSVKYGVAFALVLSILAAIGFALGGGGDLVRRGATLPRIITAYLIIGIVAGAIAGALLPLAQSMVGAAVVGFIAALPIAAGLCYFDARTPAWTLGDDVSFVIELAALGAVVVALPVRFAISRIASRASQPRGSSGR